MANVSQSTETPKLGANEVQFCAYEDRILDIYPMQKVVSETYNRVYSAGKMVEALLLLGSNQTAICISESDLSAMYYAQSELMQIIPTCIELAEMVDRGRFLDKREEDIKRVFDQHLGWVSNLIKSLKVVSESVGEFAKNLGCVAEQIPETVAKDAFLDKLPILKTLSQKTNDLLNKVSESFDNQTARYNKNGLSGITTYAN